ncbi:NAD(P)-dependent dehydrogenase, short-chain alcohol dehydrogenase family [Nonomuraea jiangxiensis]|uniref:NAD(P)-dependent dehydrogenase, short-chain alcohol dehydrogenase family n=2 Tax=Nonomuraea jiangxiensis TaxID=633440 RepID=A0A1G8QPJ8_9ACTN|nr:NAD(P)-dependent dehydrogenase, short-chain alcohol dehydrogenase family [Nonomuraea jiangxiensis]
MYEHRYWPVASTGWLPVGMTTHKSPQTPSRRNLLTAGATAVAATALSTGTALAAGTTPAPQRTRDRFAGKVVLITGATSGIGEATARAFAAEGATVFFCGRREALGNQVAASIRAAGGKATFRRADVREEDQVRDFVEACARRHGRIDIAVNNAGIESPRAVRLHEQTLADLEAVWRTNAAGVFLAMKYELPRMLERGGAIVNTASVSAEVGWATIAPYNASKHAVASLTKVAGLEYAADGIRVNALAPGAVDTPMLRRAAEAFGVTYEQIAQDYPIKRIVGADEIARVVMFLASDDSSAVVGHDLDTTGGYLAR